MPLIIIIIGHFSVLSEKVHEVPFFVSCYMTEV